MPASLETQTRRPLLTSRVFFIIFGAIAYFLIKFGGIFLVRHLFATGQSDILDNLLKISTGHPSLSFYLGWTEEKLLGPLSQLTAALTISLLAVTHIKQASLKRFIAFIFICLLITKAEALLFPPYGDAIGGPFAEAIWLKQNNFDYTGLLHQPDYSQGGPRVYVFSSYQTYLAICMKMVPDPMAAIVILHLLTYLMIAIVTSLLREILKKFFPDDISTLASLVFLFMPLVQSQAEGLNMEVPCLFFVTLSAYFLTQRKVTPASLSAIAALSVKGTGIIACGAVLIYSLYWLREGLKERKWDRKLFFWASGMALLPVLEVASKFLIKDTHASSGMIGLFKGWPSLIQFEIFYSFIGAVIIIGWFRFFQRQRLHGPEGPLWVMLLTGALWFLLLLNFFAVSPRYRLTVYPFFVFSLFYAVSLLIRSPKIQKIILTGSVALAAFSSYGFFYEPQRQHVLLERSMEYRNDLRVNLLAAKLVEDKYSSNLIGAPFLIAQTLALPELGYVKKKLNVMIYGFPCLYGGIKNFSGLEQLDIKDTVYIGKKDESGPDSPYPISPKDIILEQLSSGDKDAWIFAGGFGIGYRYRAIQLMQIKRMRALTK